MDSLTFVLPDGKKVPAHFHLTEIGKLDKSFMDCGGKVRHELKISFQLWSSIDFHHRLQPDKLLRIIEKAESTLSLEDAEIEVEYQSDTIGKYGLTYEGTHFRLVSSHTDCLAKSDCGIKENAKATKPSLLTKCIPGAGCC